MPSSATTRNLLEKQAVGENSGTWGTKLANSLEQIDVSLDGVEPIVTDGTSQFLANADYTADQAKNRVLNLTGTGGTIVIPNVEKVYLVRNASAGNVIITTGSGTTATIPQNNTEWVFSTGANVVYRQFASLDAGTLSGTIAAARIADASLSIAKTSGLQTALDAKAPLASPALTGTPTAPTATAGTNTTQLATTAFVQSAVSSTTTASGTNTPTSLAQSDLSPTFSAAHYSRVGNTVTMGGHVSAVVAATGAVAYTAFAPPIASAFTTDKQAAGYGSCLNRSDTFCVIKSESGGRLRMEFQAGATGTYDIWYNLTYQVI